MQILSHAPAANLPIPAPVVHITPEWIAYCSDTRNDTAFYSAFATKAELCSLLANVYPDCALDEKLDQFLNLVTVQLRVQRKPHTDACILSVCIHHQHAPSTRPLWWDSLLWDASAIPLRRQFHRLATYLLRHCQPLKVCTNYSLLNFG